jgi:basic amino acid/polyamine antiporter, APA family
MSSPLPKQLSTWQIALYGTGSMLGAGIYALIGKTAGLLGNALWIAFIVAMIGALLTGLSYAAVGGRYPKAGGAAYVTQLAFQRAWLSYMVGFTVMMSGLTSMATGSQAILEQLQRVGAFDNMWIKPGAILLVGCIGLILSRGLKESLWLNTLCTLAEVGGLLFIIAAGVHYWGSVDYLQLPTAQQQVGWADLSSLVLQGALLAFFSFIGFEDILNVSEEAIDPQRSVPRGLLLAMGITTVIYLAVAITAVSVMPHAELALSKTPLVDVAKRAAPWLSSIEPIYLGISIFAISNTALLNYLMGSRLLYGMSRQGLLPAALGQLHPRRHSPIIAIITLFCIVSALISLADVKQMAEATVLLLLIVFTLVNLALLRLKKTEPASAAGFDVPGFVPLLGAAVCSLLVVFRVYSAVNAESEVHQRAPMVALIILSAGTALYLMLKPKPPSVPIH